MIKESTGNESIIGIKHSVDNVFKLKISKHSIAFYKKNENPCRAPKVIIHYSDKWGQPGGAGRRAQGAAPPPTP